jgi:transcriptional regulator with GAF, ATPase, and Fis domain
VRQALEQPLTIGHGGRSSGADASADETQSRRRDQIVELLRTHRGNVSAVARSMGKVRSQVQRWIKRYGLDPASYRDG